MMSPIRIKFASRIAAWHFAISALVAVMSALFVCFVLYPYPYYQVTGSISIFMMMMAVDICCGPLCTLVVASPKKGLKESFWDFFIIGSVQVTALGYGLLSLYAARPVYEVYEKENFRVVLANEVQMDELKDALPQFQQLPVFGIGLVGVREPRSSEEQFESINLALGGIEIGLRPSWWVPYVGVASKVKEKYKPVKHLISGSDEKITLGLLKALKKYNLSEKETYYLPLENSKDEEWVVLLNTNAEIVGYAPFLSKER